MRTISIAEPLSIDHGAPVRLVIPHLYFWKSPKWINRIELMTADRAGYWEKSGYHNYGNPWEQERYASIEEPQQSAEPFLAPIEPVYPEALQMEDVDFEPQASWLRRVVGRIFPRWQ